VHWTEEFCNNRIWHYHFLHIINIITCKQFLVNKCHEHDHNIFIIAQTSTAQTEISHTSAQASAFASNSVQPPTRFLYPYNGAASSPHPHTTYCHKRKHDIIKPPNLTRIQAAKAEKTPNPQQSRQYLSGENKVVGGECICHAHVRPKSRC
jgi:hypothetical protein